MKKKKTDVMPDAIPRCCVVFEPGKKPQVIYGDYRRDQPSRWTAPIISGLIVVAFGAALVYFQPEKPMTVLGLDHDDLHAFTEETLHHQAFEPHPIAQIKRLIPGIVGPDCLYGQIIDMPNGDRKICIIKQDGTGCSGDTCPKGDFDAPKAGPSGIGRNGGTYGFYEPKSGGAGAVGMSHAAGVAKPMACMPNAIINGMMQCLPVPQEPPRSEITPPPEGGQTPEAACYGPRCGTGAVRDGD